MSAFRTRLIASSAASLSFDRLLTQCRGEKLLRARGRQRTDATGCPLGGMLDAVRALNRREVVGETLRHTLDDLAVVAPEWLRQHAPPDWLARYDHRAEQDSPARASQRRRPWR